MKNKLVFLVVSSDDYDDLIDGFIHFKEKFVVTDSFEFYFVLENKIRSNYDNYTFITSKKKNWSDRILTALHKIDSDFVFILPEDFYFFHEINISLIVEIIEFSKANNIDYISRVSDFNHLTLEYQSINVNYFKKKMPGFSLKRHGLNSYGLYKTTFLKNILMENENIWEFESNSGSRLVSNITNNYRYFISGKDPFALYAPGIIYRGKLTSEGNSMLLHNGFNFKWENKKRIATTKDDSVFIRLYRIPPRYLKRFKNMILYRRKLKYFKRFSEDKTDVGF